MAQLACDCPSWAAGFAPPAHLPAFPATSLADGAWQDKPTAEQRFVAAAATNARLIRQAITDFRKDVVRRGRWHAADLGAR